MSALSRRKRIVSILLGLAFLLSLALGTALGFALAGTRNYQVSEEMDVMQSALPTRIYDINNNLITEFFSDEKREIVPLDAVPEVLVNALVTREDQEFYRHWGIKPSSYFRAFLGYVTGNFAGGGSTLTMQVAGTRHANRREITVRRKLQETWYAVQMERRYTKDEILEFYMNEMPFGGGTNGVEAASKYYFQKSVREINLAEAVILVLTLSGPDRYNPLKNPALVRERQRYILDEMVRLGYADRTEADQSFDSYWDSYAWDRYATYGAFVIREDKAPWFSEYVRQELADLLLGSQDIYRGGMKVYTTLELDYQAIADDVMQRAINRVNSTYRSQFTERTGFGDENITPLVDLFSLMFDFEEVRVAGEKKRSRTARIFREEVNPVMDLTATLFNLQPLKRPAQITFGEQVEVTRRTEVEGALIALEIESGHIIAMVGGKEFSSANQYNRAVQGNLQPGSAFKPLYYSVALEEGLLTPASILRDGPTAFENDDGTRYVPSNYGGTWRGKVRVRQALALSLNIPSVKVLQTVGFDAAIRRASRLLGISDPEEITANFDRKLPLGLGICSVSPLQMARAFACFANEGREVEPVAIRYIQDRNGNTILEPEREAIARRNRPEAQIMSPQAAFLVTNLLQSTVNWGTLAYGTRTVGGFDGRDIAGKTGTVENWGDAWAVGFTPQIVAAVWFGFDSPGNSLGRNQTGARAAGPTWAEFMKAAHEGLPMEEFSRPKEGIAEVTVCVESGLLPHPEGFCDDVTYEEYFLEGTEPSQFCDVHGAGRFDVDERVDVLRRLVMGADVSFPEIPAAEFDAPFFFEEDWDSGESAQGNPLLD